MTNTSKTIIFFGTEDFSATILTRLIESGYNIAAVVTKPDTKRGRGHRLAMPLVKEIALKNHIEVWQPLKVAEINDRVMAFGNVAGVLVSYGKIIPKSTISLFTPGIINVHPSLLPRYRGPSPIESAIANGDAKTGVSIMQLSPEMDAGPVYATEEYLLHGDETRAKLYEMLADFGANLLIDVLPGILNDSLRPISQDESKATYCKLLSKDDANLNLALLSATKAERLIRAHLGFPKSKVVVNGHQIIITKAHITNQQKTPLDLLCQDGAYLSVDGLIAPSGRSMNQAAFLRGYAVA